MEKKILLYSEKEAKYSAIRQLAEAQSAEVKRLTRAEYGIPIFRLLGLPDYVPFQAERPVPALYELPELMIFHGFGSEELDVFLAAYRAEALEPIPLKAITTLYNLGWTPLRLAEQLKEEHEQYKGKTGAEKKRKN